MGTLRGNLRWMQEQVASFEVRIDVLTKHLEVAQAQVKLEREGAAKLLEFVADTRIPKEGPIGAPLQELLAGTARAIRGGVHLLPASSLARLAIAAKAEEDDE